MENETKIVCRKCQGPHLTIKCGKEKENKVETKIQAQIQEKPRFEKPAFNNNNNNNYRGGKHGKVKISNLPGTISEEDMLELLKDWGYVHKVKVMNYESYSIAYLEFKAEDQADYFTKAFDNTACNNLIMQVERLLE